MTEPRRPVDLLVWEQSRISAPKLSAAAAVHLLLLVLIVDLLLEPINPVGQIADLLTEPPELINTDQPGKEDGHADRCDLPPINQVFVVA